MNVSVGTCGRCGGRVSVPANWMSTLPPTATCESCGAIPRAAHGPVLDMQDSPRTVTANRYASATEIEKFLESVRLKPNPPFPVSPSFVPQDPGLTVTEKALHEYALSPEQADARKAEYEALSAAEKKRLNDEEGDAIREEEARRDAVEDEP